MMVNVPYLRLFSIAIMCVFVTHQVDCQENTTDSSENASQPLPANSSDYQSHEYRLILELLRRYSNNRILSRPVKNVTDAVVVSFNLYLQQIVALQEKTQEIITQVWKHYGWKDEYLEWDPTEYGGLKAVKLPSERIWTPDIVLYNSLKNDGFERDELKVSLMVDHTGDVIWIPMVIYSSGCPVSATNFPFDTQTCMFQFGSWVFSSDELNLVANVSRGFDLSNYLENSLWGIAGNVARLNIRKYDCCPELYMDATFELCLRRKSGFYTRVLLIPVTMAALLIPFIFLIPPRRPDRTSLCLSLFGTFSFLLLVVAGLLPPSATDSRIGEFCCSSIVATITASMLSLLVVNVIHSEKPLPAWTQTIFIRWLMKKLCIRVPSSSRQNQKQPPEEITISQLGYQLPGEITASRLENKESSTSHETKPTLTEASHDPGSKLKQTARERDAFAGLLDRMCFIIFIFVIICFFIFIFPFPFRS